MDNLVVRAGCLRVLTVFVPAFIAACGGSGAPQQEVASAPAAPVVVVEPVTWGEVVGGVRTRVRIASREMKLGSPGLIDVQLQNIQSADATFYYEDGILSVDDPFLITDPDGKVVRNIEPVNYSRGTPDAVSRGETVAIISNFNIFASYLITMPGAYGITYRSRPSGYRDVLIPASGRMDVVVGVGEVPIEDRIVSVAAGVMPDGWRIARTRSSAVMVQGQTTSGGVTVSIFRPTEKELDMVTVKLWVLENPLMLDENGEFFGRKLDYLGRCEFGHAYLASEPRVALLWSDHRERLIEAFRAEISPE